MIRKNTARRFAYTLVTLTAFSAAANAQERSGFTFSVGIGGGSAQITCDDCGDERRSAVTGYLRAGGVIRPNFILAGEVNGWTKKDGDARSTISTVNAVALWYPSSSGLYLSGGVGFGNLTFEFSEGAVTLSVKGTGFAYQVGAGYDITVGTTIAITPFATYFRTAGVEFEGTGGKANGNVIHAGLGLTWR